MTTTTTKRSLRARIEELQAARHKSWTVDRPKWMQKPRILRHVKEAEMVALDRNSPLAKLPAELQLHVISYMDYEDVLCLKHSARYFNFFINSDVVKGSREAQMQRFKNMENTPGAYTDKLPCYSCLKMKPRTEYWHKSGRYYLNNAPYSAARGTTRHTVDDDRHCIRCSFNEGRYEPGLKLNTGTESWMICACCGILVKESAGGSYTYPATVCKPCSAEYNLMRGFGGLIRMFQWMVSVVILALGCTGKFMPWTSRADEHSLRWIFMITLDLLTIGATFCSVCARMQSNQSAYSHKRTENCKFVFIVEFTAFVLWSAILVTTFTAASDQGFTGRYDRFAKALTAMLVLESLLFLATTLLANKLTLGWLFKETRRPKIGSIV